MSRLILQFGLALMLLTTSVVAFGVPEGAFPYRVVESLKPMDAAPPVRLRSEELPHLWREQRQLSQPTPEAVREALGPPDTTPPRIGINRSLDSASGPINLGPALAWEYLSDGGWMAIVEIESPGAKAVRAGIEVESLPEGLELRFFGDEQNPVHRVDATQIMEMIQRNRAVDGDTSEANTFWSPVIDGSSVGIELYLPPGENPDFVSASIPLVSHLVESPYDVSANAFRTMSLSAGCNIDVMCHPEWDIGSRSVAHIIYSDGPSTRICSGVLLNSPSSAPYFFTAEHCISSQTNASSIFLWWLYRSTACNASDVGSEFSVGGIGAELLYAGTSHDSSLLLLNFDPPPGVVYAGWIAGEPPVLHEPAAGIHHPRGDPQKISFGSVHGFANCSTGDAQGRYNCWSASQETAEYIDVRFTSGITESGSSGSPLFSRGDAYVIGVLRGSSVSCANPTAPATYGRFDRAFAAGDLGRWLLATTETYQLSVTRKGTGSGTVTSTPAGISCGSDCSAEYQAGATVTLAATPSQDSKFVQWGGACAGSSVCVVTMDQSKAVSAQFDSEHGGGSGGIQDNRFFVEQQYRDFLGREGDEGGINFWVQELESGRVTRAGLVEDFFLSPEFQSGVAPVARLYFAYFGRIPDYPGLQFWVGELQGGRSLNDMSQAFAASPEFVATYGDLDDGEFVDLVYWNVLGRAPEPEGHAFWISQLAAGMSRGAMMVEFSESAEYQALSFNEVQVTMMYVSMLRRAPDQAGFDYWVAELAAGRSILGLIDGFLASPEYLRRFSDNVDSHIVTAVAGIGGDIQPPTQAVTNGDSAAFTVAPGPGYSIGSVAGCGGSLDGNIYTTGAITQDCAVSATFTVSQDDDALIFGRYLPVEDGWIIRDTETGLEWQRCSVGQTWNPGSRTCDGTALHFLWDDAVEAHGTWDDTTRWPDVLLSQMKQPFPSEEWRLPTIKQLGSLLYCSNGMPAEFDPALPCVGLDFIRPTINNQAFPNSPMYDVWSGSSAWGGIDGIDEFSAWRAHFWSGYVTHNFARGTANPVRLLRNPSQ